MTDTTEAAPTVYPEPQGYSISMGFVKNNPLNNPAYLAKWEGDPWFPILKQTDEALERIIPGYNIAQVKEKFGGLRYYITYPATTTDEQRERARSLVQYAEAWVDGFEAARAAQKTQEV